MAKSEKAAAAVEKLFKKKPGADLDEFIEVAKKADSSVEGMGKRSFNATYVLPLKRKVARKKKKAKPSKRQRTTKKAAKKTTKKKAKRKTRKRAASKGTGNYQQLRQLVLERDQQVLDALVRDPDPRQAYELAAGVDEYIGRLVDAVKSGK